MLDDSKLARDVVEEEGIGACGYPDVAASLCAFAEEVAVADRQVGTPVDVPSLVGAELQAAIGDGAYDIPVVRSDLRHSKVATPAVEVTDDTHCGVLGRRLVVELGPLIGHSGQVDREGIVLSTWSRDSLSSSIDERTAG